MTADNLAAWNVDPSGFPAAGTSADKARFAVRYRGSRSLQPQYSAMEIRDYRRRAPCLCRSHAKPAEHRSVRP